MGVDVYSIWGLKSGGPRGRVVEARCGGDKSSNGRIRRERRREGVVAEESRNQETELERVQRTA